MRKVIFLSLLLLTASQIIEKPQSARESYQSFLAEHPFNNRARLSKEEWKNNPPQDRPDLAWEQNYIATMDPVLGRPAVERLEQVYQIVDQSNNQPIPGIPGSAASPWTERGPDNVGGRTRAIMWDPNASSGNKVWAGGVTGGLWYNNNITASSSAWVSVSNQWDNLAITAIAYDPNNSQIFYVGTGEGWGAGASRGAGIWKSTNGGTSWTQLSSTGSYHYINDLVVRNESGSSVVYAACRRNYFRGQWHGVNGLYRSVNGGTSWSQVLPNIPGTSSQYAAADIEIAADNRLWVGTQETSLGLSDQGGGRVLYSDNGTTWTVSRTVTNGERVELACAPSNSNYVYALTEIAGQAGEISRTTNKGSTWSTRSEPADVDNGIPNSDFTRGQAWYDLIMAVDPNDANTLVAGGINLFRSTDGANNWSQISKWSNNNNLAALNCSYVHADQHQVVFKPNSSSTVLFGTDGGVFYTTSLATAATSNVISARNKDYNVTQFYAGAIHPSAGSNYALAGAQDNGTQKFTAAGFGSTVRATGGDGAYCFIDQTNASYQITSYVYNNFWRSTNGGTSWGGRFQNDNSTGRFINPAEYDDNQGILYSARTSSTVNRVTGIRTSPSISSISISGMSSMASHLRVSPYTTTSTTLYLGTEGGDLFKVTNANTSPSSSNIGSSSFPNGHISCVELGASENELLVTFSNYGVTSIWYSSNGGTSWQNKEGNLPDMPVRWALFNPNNRNEVILATEVGVWSTSNFNSSSPSWTASNSGLSRVRVDMLQIRDSDQMVIAATHGRGLFSSNGFGIPQVPVADFYADPEIACLNQTIQLSDSSTGNPSTWQWNITPSTFSYVSGTSSSSQHPQIQLSAAGPYTVSLTVANANGSDSLAKVSFLQGAGLGLPFIEDFEGSSNLFTVDNPDNSVTWALNTIGGSSPGNTAAGIDFYSYGATGQRDGLISPPLNFNNYSSVSLDFDYSYARYNSSYRDSMAIYISTDCGVTYQRIASYSSDPGVNFATAADQTASFSPSSVSDWCGNTLITNCPSINLNSYAGQSGVRIKFEAINGYGNNLYLDNINISGTQTSNVPSANFAANDSNVCAGSVVSFSDLSTNLPSSWTWSISPATFSYSGGTSSSSQNPQVQFNGSGLYNVTLTATNSSGTSTEIKNGFIQVEANLNPTVQISANASSWCSGQNAIFTASPTEGGSSPSYQWKVNGSNIGTNSATFSSSSLAQGDAISVVMTSSSPCLNSTTATSNIINASITTTVLPTVSISTATTTICAGSNASFSANISNGGSAPTYQWKVNGNNVGTNSNSYSSSALANGDQVSLEVISNATCASTNPGVSNTLNMQVNLNLNPAVQISANASSWCSGQNAIFTASPTAGGSSPSYQWKVNGSNVGTNSATFSSSSLAQGDAVSAVMTSSGPCLNSTTATSNTINATITAPVLPTVSISTASTTLCAGSNASFSANISNGGGAPTYQWKVNGNNVGTNSNSYSSSTLANGDQVSLEVISNATCASTSPGVSNTLNMVVRPLPVITTMSPPFAPLCLGDSLVLSATVNNNGISGSLTAWSGPGVQNGVFYASLAGAGSHSLSIGYLYANQPDCPVNASFQISVNALTKPTISRSGLTLNCNQAGLNYLWLLNGSAAPGINNQQTYSLQINGSYSVETSNTICSLESDPEDIIDMSIESLKAEWQWLVYPNPSQDIIQISLTNPGQSEMEIFLYDARGSLLYSSRRSLNGMEVLESFSVKNFAAGIYHLKVQIGDLAFHDQIRKE